MKEKILQESMERRDRFTKHFHMEHKGMAAAVYPMPVHYETEDGAFEEIDNRLEYNQLETENNKEVYQNKASDVKVQFAKSAYEEELVGIEKDGNRITWSFVPVQMEKYQRSGSARPVKEFRVLGQEETKDQPEVLEKALQEQAALPSKETGAASIAGADPQPASAMEETAAPALPEAEPSQEASPSPDGSPEPSEETREEEIKRLMGVPHLRSEGVYEDILSGLDLHYTIQGDRIKEDITLKTKEAAQVPLTGRRRLQLKLLGQRDRSPGERVCRLRGSDL